MKSGIGIILILTLFGCKQEKPATEENKIDRIVLATGGCFGHCSYQALDIHQSLQVNYFGGEYARMEGYYHSTIQQKVWDTICKKLNDYKYNECDSVYSHSVDDQSIELIIYSGNKKKRIRGQEASFPAELRTLFFEIIDLSNKIELIKSKNPHHFPTSYQKEMVIMKPIQFLSISE